MSGRRRGPALPADPVEVEIVELGARGDGIGQALGRPVFVPLALPGDRLLARLTAPGPDGWRGLPVAWRHQAPRAASACGHFGDCGGCQLQHLADPARAAWQRAQIATALARRGLVDVPIAAPVPGAPASRRRLRLAWARQDGRPALGLRAARGHRIVPIAACPAGRPELAQLLAPLRTLLASLALAAAPGEVQLTMADSSLDVLLSGGRTPTLADREALAAFATAQDLARLAWQAGPASPVEPIAQRRPVEVAFEGCVVALPPGAFLQASAAAEAAIRGAVRRALGNSVRLAELFAGCGALGLPLAAAGRRVQAYERDPAMVAALLAGARRAGLAERVRAAARDLDRAPLAGAELAGLEAVLLDPPRAGAAAQAAALAASAVPRIAMVSCHPQSFARDARTLVDGGYRLLWAQPIDAFLWSARIELVGAFERAR